MTERQRKLPSTHNVVHNPYFESEPIEIRKNGKEIFRNGKPWCSLRERSSMNSEEKDSVKGSLSLPIPAIAHPPGAGVLNRIGTRIAKASVVFNPYNEYHEPPSIRNSIRRKSTKAEGREEYEASKLQLDEFRGGEVD